MNKRHATNVRPSSTENRQHEIPKANDALNAGLTDDERVSREDETFEDGARVTPGPADLERVERP